MTLEEIAIKHKTQKVPHGYMPIYESFFETLRGKEITLVEVGVWQGASMKTWAEYFYNGRIIGLEKQVQWDSTDENIEVFHCDVADKDSVNECMAHRKADIIIDDGSHIATEQLAAFVYLWPFLKKGGWYVVEDLFALYDPAWNKQNEWNIIDEINSRMKNILVGGDDIQEVHWFGRNNINGIVFLRKRYEDYRIQPLEEFNM